MLRHHDQTINNDIPKFAGLQSRRAAKSEKEHLDTNVVSTERNELIYFKLGPVLTRSGSLAILHLGTSTAVSPLQTFHVMLWKKCTCRIILQAAVFLLHCEAK